MCRLARIAGTLGRDDREEFWRAEAKRLKASGRALPAQSTAAMPSAPAARAVQ